MVSHDFEESLHVGWNSPGGKLKTFCDSRFGDTCIPEQGISQVYLTKYTEDGKMWPPIKSICYLQVTKNV